jgi:protein TonB
MSPFPVAPPEEELQTKAEPCSACAQPEQPGSAKRPALVIPAKQRHEIFSGSLLELSDTRPRRRWWDVALSIVFHTTALAGLVLLPLFFSEALDLKQFTRTLLVAPPPPPPPPPPAAPAVAIVRQAPRRIFSAGGRLVAPIAIPSKVAMIKEEPLPPDADGVAGVVGGVPGGVPGGQAGGVIGGIIGGVPRTTIVAPPVAQPRAPIRVGGRVQAPRSVFTPDPVYPALARQARIEGDVQLDAVIDARGNVVELSVVSGHPLLLSAAMAAVRQWRYQPTFLNDEAVPVQLIVVVRFRLNAPMR